MLFKSNILALVGRKENNIYPPNKVIIWDDSIAKVFLEFVFKCPVLMIKLHKEMIIIGTINCVFVYSLRDYELIDAIDTFNNPHKAIALSYAKNSCVLACPYTEEGYVRVRSYGKNLYM